jgi:hypothetical protein
MGFSDSFRHNHLFGRVATYVGLTKMESVWRQTAGILILWILTKPLTVATTIYHLGDSKILVFTRGVHTVFEP